MEGEYCNSERAKNIGFWFCLGSNAQPGKHTMYRHIKFANCDMIFPQSTRMGKYNLHLRSSNSPRDPVLTAAMKGIENDAFVEQDTCQKEQNSRCHVASLQMNSLAGHATERNVGALKASEGGQNATSGHDEDQKRAEKRPRIFTQVRFCVHAYNFVLGCVYAYIRANAHARTHMYIWTCTHIRAHIQNPPPILPPPRTPTPHHHHNHPPSSTLHTSTPQQNKNLTQTNTHKQELTSLLHHQVAATLVMAFVHMGIGTVYGYTGVTLPDLTDPDTQDLFLSPYEVAFFGRVVAVVVKQFWCMW